MPSNRLHFGKPGYGTRGMRLSLDHTLYRIQDNIAVPSIKEMIPKSLKV